MLFRRYGCHHCGKRFGQVIADHQPPNKTVYGASRRLRLSALRGLLWLVHAAQAARRRRWRRRLRTGW